ncbi:hypothetical protein B0H16DRAFT_1537593 [Mycena metata]|uniref:Uncharacterized protein n=1 Tax=Mycena metata TaxID=1033252 RepID=A0AAD7NEY2_9AGAR|nr:hypothetical protein B0H16DRAFT_1537593 [Mycena metata]
MTSSMSIEEAFDWFGEIPQGEKLDALTPEQEVWLNHNDGKIQEALGVLFTYYAAAGMIPSRPLNSTTEHSGSLFSIPHSEYTPPLYSDPPTIVFSHQGSTYTVSDPQHVAALHSIRDWPAAIAYLQTHAESRVPNPPLVFTVPAIWHPDVFPGTAHPDELQLHGFNPEDEVPAALHDAAAFPTIADISKARVREQCVLPYPDGQSGTCISRVSTGVRGSTTSRNIMT